jgi:hypothetical protein
MKITWDPGGFTARISEPGSRKGASDSRERILNENSWRELYREALLELGLEKLGERVEAAEKANRARISLDGEVPSEERIALQDAVKTLAVLKRERR